MTDNVAEIAGKLSAAQALAARLRPYLDASPAEDKFQMNVRSVRVLVSAVEALGPEAGKLPSLIERFREAAECIDPEDGPDDCHIWEHAAGMNISFGDLRAVRSYLKGQP